MLASPHIEHLLRELTPQVLGPLVRKSRDFAAAEDALQEALLAAAEQWPEDGVPDNPRAWLMQVASRKLTDQIRSDIARRNREQAAAQVRAMETGYVMPAPEVEETVDDTLKLIFLCCHPSLTRASAIALTLRAVGGLTTAEIARAFLVPESTMAQRISRAKQAIQASGEPFRMPHVEERAERLSSVLHVLYLIFNEGYMASSGDQLQRIDVSAEAIRLTRLVHKLTPKDAEATGLLALMLLTDARRDARAGQQGEAIPLDKQNRLMWDRGLIAEGVDLVGTALEQGAVGPYQLQAAIAAVHDEASCVEDTDWPQILALYDLLARMSANPMVMLNRAVAVAMVHGPKAGLEQLEKVKLDGHYRVDAVRGHLLEMAGERELAIESYQSAAARSGNLPERNYLLTRAAELRGE
ncbi:MAG: DUF6596 domain-containing protein [Acidobacteriota bacterium]